MTSVDDRKRRLALHLLEGTSRPLGFIDVGSGGPLKAPWALLPSERVRKHDIEPLAHDEMPTCISDHHGRASFNVADNPRASSLHTPNAEFIQRHDQAGLAVRKTIEVNLRTLSEVFGHLRNSLDVMDVNVEGHDNQVLRGAGTVFDNNFIKLVKVEYELTEVWSGQSWFGETDGTMRSRDYDLAAMNVEYSQPVNARGLRRGAEPIWGKALYVPKQSAWKARAGHLTRDDYVFAMCLYALFDLPGRALDVAAIAEHVETRGARMPNEATLREALVRLYGGTPFALRAARAIWRTFPETVRARLQPFVERLV